MNTLGPINELTTARYTCTLLDETGTAIPAADLTTFTLTLYDRATGTVINSRSAQNVLNANNVTVDASGNVVWTMQPADNGITSAALAVESHVALFTATWAVTKAMRHEVEILVKNVTKVPS